MLLSRTKTDKVWHLNPYTMNACQGLRCKQIIYTFCSISLIYYTFLLLNGCFSNQTL